MGLDLTAFSKKPTFNNEEYKQLLDKNHRANELNEWIGEFFDSQKIFDYWKANATPINMRDEYPFLVPQINKMELKNGPISENDNLDHLLDPWQVLPPEKINKAIEILKNRAYVTEKTLVIIEFLKNHPTKYIAFW